MPEAMSLEPGMRPEESSAATPDEASPELLSQAAHDPRAVGEVYEIYYNRIFSFAVRRLLNTEDAEDVTASTFLKMARNLRKYRRTGRPFSSWLYRIAVNEINDLLRKRSKIRIISIDEEDSRRSSVLSCMVEIGPSQSERLIRLERFQALHEAVARLPLKYQTVVTLRYFEGLTLKEIAYATRTKVGLVKWRLHQAIKKLRAQFSNCEDY